MSLWQETAAVGEHFFPKVNECDSKTPISRARLNYSSKWTLHFPMPNNAKSIFSHAKMIIVRVLNFFLHVRLLFCLLPLFICWCSFLQLMQTRHFVHLFLAFQQPGGLIIPSVPSKTFAVKHQQELLSSVYCSLTLRITSRPLIIIIISLVKF